MRDIVKSALDELGYCLFQMDGYTPQANSPQEVDNLADLIDRKLKERNKQ